MEKKEIRHKRARLEDVVPRSAPFIIFLDPCGACNFKCGFCPCNISDESAAERHKIMSWDLFEKILEDLKAFDGAVKVINLFNYGEPLLNPRLADMVRALKKSNCCREVRITTNGSLLSEEKSRALIDAGVDLLRVSVESLSSKGYREICGVGIDFDEIVHNVETFFKLAKSTNGQSKITATIFSNVLEEKDDEKRFFEIFSPITDYCFLKEVKHIWGDFQEGRLGENQFEKENGEKSENRKICTMPFTDMSIHSNGVVGACCSDWNFTLQLGDVKKERLAEIWNGKRHREFQCALLSRKPVSFCEGCMRTTPDQIEDPETLIKKILGES